MQPPSPGMDLRHLRLVAAIAEHGNLTAAGRALRLSQSALSHQLADLEKRLGTPLFVRTVRRMVPTPAGDQLVQVARIVLDQISEFERHVLDGEFETTHGSVRIATECYTAYHWLPTVLREFRGRWPGVNLRVAAEHTSAPIVALREGALDLALVYHPVSDKRLRLEPLFDDEMVLVTSSGHHLARQPFAPIEALREEHLFAYTSETGSLGVVGDILEPAAVQPAEVTRIQLTEAIIELVAAGLGVAILARWAVAPAVRTGLVECTRIGRNGYPRTWFAAVRNQDVAPAYQVDLIGLLRRHMRTARDAHVIPRLRLS